MHVLELPKFVKAVEELTEPLEAWCYFLIHGADLDPRNLPSTLKKPEVERAMEVLEMVSQTDLERERYLAREKVALDERSRLYDARVMVLKAKVEAHAEGRAEGHAEGRAEGRAEGHAEGRAEAMKESVSDRIHLLQRLLRLPMTPRTELMTQSLDALREIAAALERQAGVPEPGA